MYSGDHASAPPVTLDTLRRMKVAGDKIVSLTAYDASFAAQMDAAGVEWVLVGDSLGMVIEGHDSTLPVTLDTMVHHTKAVARGLRRGFLVADLPFGTCNTAEQAMHSAVRLMQEGGARMIKLEGGALQRELVAHLTARGVPVCAHIGLQPQFVHKLGGYKVQGRSAEAAAGMREEASALVAAGADMLLLECVPAALAAEITASVPVPVIGIGAGAAVDGQILVVYDILGISLGKRPRFSKDFLAGRGSIADALQAYARAVKQGEFPAAEHSF
ncbi:MAG TPA: 3-methyl-2-oxobutanoate hydroxymethyltransferase [Candidatus Macondimonas sp.]|nr:3-methyl-2-oxobutanoate hydroxymethyltransferase [Candidatus Macondimonas sp.]